MFEVPPSAAGRLSLQNDGIFGGIAFPLAQMDCYMLFIVRDKRTINSIMQKPINQDNLDQALTLLAGRLDIAQSEPVRLVVCGGSALIAMGLRQRTTKDMDVVALMNAAHELVSPDPLPDFLLTAAGQVARDLGCHPRFWNQGKASSSRARLTRLVCHPRFWNQGKATAPTNSSRESVCRLSGPGIPRIPPAQVARPVHAECR